MIAHVAAIPKKIDPARLRRSKFIPYRLTGYPRPSPPMPLSRTPNPPNCNSTYRNSRHSSLATAFSLVLQAHFVAAVRGEAGAPVDAQDFHVELFAVDANEQVVIRVLAAIDAGPDQVV